MTSARTRPHGMSLYIGPNRGQKNSPDVANETTGWLRPVQDGRKMSTNGLRQTSAEEQVDVTVGGDESRNRRSNSALGTRLDRPLAPGERLTADGDRISVRQISREA